ncbi:MAG TPA: methyltransferase [Candidatus Paceibacterota bacterium]|nr:methyltransferase [Candidatus Paceibacterota bacterium]
MEKERIEKEQRRPRIHRVLAQSYLVYLFALFAGLIFSAAFPVKIHVSDFLLSLSAVILMLSSVLIFWAQKSTKNFKKENITKESFKKGPYRYLRNPTNIGIFLLMLSFGVIVNSVSVILFTIVASFFARFVFLRKEKSLLEKKYGKAYIEYKKDVIF